MIIAQNTKFQLLGKRQKLDSIVPKTVPRFTFHYDSNLLVLFIGFRWLFENAEHTVFN